MSTKIQGKNQSFFSIMAIRSNFSVICQVRATVNPEKFYVVAVCAKKQDGESGQFAQWFCNHWHIAAFTSRYANELEAES
jgi:hypothetical protein